MPEPNLDIAADARVTVFFNPKTGLEVFGGVEEFFPLKHNGFVAKDNQN